MGVSCRRCSHVSLTGGSSSMRRPTGPGCGAGGLAGCPTARRCGRRGRPGGDPRGCGAQLTRTGLTRTGLNRTGARATAVLPNGADPAGRSNHAVADCAVVRRARVWSALPYAAPLCLRCQLRCTHRPHWRSVRQRWLGAGPTVFAMPVSGPGAFCDTSGTGAIRRRGRSGCERGDAEASVAT
jgi:hypothetical protein